MMKLKLALTTALLLAALPVMAQAPSAAPKPAPAPAPAGGSAPPAQAPLSTNVDPTKATAIRHLMEVTGSAKLGDQIGTFITGQVRQAVSQGIQPADRLQKFMDEFNKNFTTHFKPSQIDDNAVSIYANNLSLEDIQDITKFYESPVGQRMIKALPMIVQQSQNSGVQIAQQAAMETLRSMSTEYPELKTMLPQENPSIAPTPGPGQAPSGNPNQPRLTPIPQGTPSH
jgi:uncharacterized protein